MKKYFLISILLFMALPILAQTSNLDEFPLPVLKQKLAASKGDTTRVQIQLALGHLILYKSGGGSREIDSALYFAGQAANLSRQLKFDTGIINAMLLFAETFNQNRQKEKGFRTAQQALLYAKKVRNNDGMARSYRIMGQHYSISDPFGQAKRMEYNNKAIEIFRKEKNTLWQSFTMLNNAEVLFMAGKKTQAIKMLFEILNMGDAVSQRTVEGIYWLIGKTSTELSDYQNGLKYNLLALKTAKKVGDTTLLLSHIYNTIATVYVKKQDYHQALTHSLTALRIARHYRSKDFISQAAFVSAIAYTRTNKLDKALSLLEEIRAYASDDPGRLQVTSAFVSNLTYAKQYKKAGTYVKGLRGLLLRVPPYHFTEVMDAYDALSRYYLETRQTDLALSYTALYAGLVRSHNYPLGIKTAENLYYKLDSIKGDFKSAINHYLAAQQIKDSTENVTQAYQMSLLAIENETEQKNNHIETLTRQSQLKDSQLKQNELTQKAIIAVSLLLLVIIALLYSRYRLKQKTNHELEANQRELDHKNVNLGLLNIEQQKLLREKEWLIKEVHHRVKNNLQMVTSLLKSQSKYLDNDAAKLAIKDSLRRMQAISMIHQKLYQDETISTISMPAYINELIHYLHSSFDNDNRILFKQGIEAIELEVSQAIPLGLIISESIVNAIKHAFLEGENGTVKITLRCDKPEHILLMISDNGKGLPDDFHTSELSKSLGLELMQGLARQLRGNFKIDSNNGVHITVKFPIINK